MLNITKVNNSIKVEGLDNKQFPDNGTLMIPLNSVILTLDESNIATFRSAANNDVLFSGVITDIQISGSTVTKQTITTAFTAIANSSVGGGGTVDAYTKAETDALLATKANESELSDYATVESLATVATTGSYNDLANKPTIPAAQIQSDWNQSDNSAADYIKNKPVNVSAFTNDAGYLTQHQSLADYSTTQEMNTAIATATNDMATMTWVGEQGYLTQHQDISDLFNGAEYDTQTKRINFKHGDTVVAYIDATPFVVDGMIDTVEITSGNLVITWNTDAGKQSTSIPLTDIFNPDNYYSKTETDTLLAAKANSADLATVATTGDYDDLSNKPTIPTVPTNVSAFTNDAGYTTNEGTITGITMNGVSKGTSGVVDLGTVITNISGKQDVIDSSHKLDADLVDDTTSTNKFVTSSDKSKWSGKQDALVSGTNIKTINNESILGSGNITIQGGGSSYTAGDNINITNDVISVDIDDEKKVIASALVELHNDKADKNQLNNYQLKGNYVEQSAVDASIAAAVANYRTEAEAINVEKVDAAAFNDLNKRVTALETAVGNISSVLDAINGETT